MGMGLSVHAMVGREAGREGPRSPGGGEGPEVGARGSKLDIGATSTSALMEAECEAAGPAPSTGSLQTRAVAALGHTTQFHAPIPGRDLRAALAPEDGPPPCDPTIDLELPGAGTCLGKRWGVNRPREASSTEAHRLSTPLSGLSGRTQLPDAFAALGWRRGGQARGGLGDCRCGCRAMATARCATRAAAGRPHGWRWGGAALDI